MNAIGPFEVMTTDRYQKAVVGWQDGSFYFVVQERGETVDRGGADGEFPNLLPFLARTATYVDWPANAGLVDALLPCDPALSIRSRRLVSLVGARMLMVA